MAEGIAERQVPLSFAGRLGLAPGLLLVAAVLHLALATAAQAAIGQVSLVEPATVIGHLTDAGSFVLAAAVLAGTNRWPGGRRWLILGAVALATRGVLDTALQAWMWWAFSLGPWRLAALDQTFPYVRGIAALVAGVAAPALLAKGLMATPATSSSNPARRRAAAALVLLGLVGLAVDLRLAPAMATRSPISTFDATSQVLGGLALAGMAALGAVALHRLPAHYRMPELLIGIGAGLSVAGGTGQAAVHLGLVLIGPIGAYPGLMTLTGAVMLVGLLGMIGGFAVARIVPPRGARPPRRAW